MQLDVEVSPPAFVRAQLELECNCSVPELYMQCRLNVGCIGVAVHVLSSIACKTVEWGLKSRFWPCDLDHLPWPRGSTSRSPICHVHAQTKFEDHM